MIGGIWHERSYSLFFAFSFFSCYCYYCWVPGAQVARPDARVSVHAVQSALHELVDGDPGVQN